jgi:hypothetical protein
MANNKDVQSCAQAEEDEPVFISGMIRVIDQEGVLVDEDGLSFLERYAMLSPIGGILAWIPLEAEPLHIYHVNTLYIFVKDICRAKSLNATACLILFCQG